MEVILNINNLEYKYLNDQYIFTNLCLYIEKNKVTTISGSNNCGKTTLLKLLSINRYQKKGCIIINGKDITDYNQKEYNEMVQAVFPNINNIEEKQLMDEIQNHTSNKDEEKVKYILKELELDKKRNKEISKWESSEIIKLQIAKAILNSNSIVLIDSIDQYYSKKEIEKIYLFLKKCIEKYDLTFIITSVDLRESLYTDDLYILNNGSILLHGDPIKVLEKDNIINKAGLKIPFMIDLSVKLKDYDLINKIELDEGKLIDTLWK